MYGPEWVTVSLPVLYRGGERVRTGVEELLMEERLVLRALLYSMLGGKLNAKLWTQELEVGGLQVRAAVMGFLVRCSLEVETKSNNCCTWSWTGST